VLKNVLKNVKSYCFNLFLMLYLYCKQGKGGRKMKSNKGFTLIELLAVIVILAIIALIATPTILNVIETARKGSAESSALGYIDAIEKQIAIDMLETNEDDKVLKFIEGKSIVFSVSQVGDNFSVKGQKPEGTSKLAYDVDKGIITTACLEIKLSSGDYMVEYYGEADDDNAAGSAKAVVKGETGACNVDAVTVSSTTSTGDSSTGTETNAAGDNVSS
jgi:type IV pilus assembly protein PilA